MRRKIAAVFMLVAASVFVLATPQDVDDHGTILKFSTMVGVTGPYVGPTNPIRGVPGGGLPWIIADGRGHLKSSGELHLRTRGLVLPDPPFNFTNPLPDFRAIVSCQSIDASNNPTVVNVITDPYPADAAGNSDLKTTVSLPQPCIAPIIFVVHPTSDPPRWFAATGL
ncbi:MAG TPA: hypothetical protein VFH31_17885 [Pyrinomonadaceae bacterium]|nr:hypothetical protein [Pyrinomonadaceae bacterium]